MPARPTSLFAAALLAAIAVAPATAQSPAISPTPGPSLAPAATPFPSTAIPAVPTPGAIVDPAPVPWEHVTVSPDGVSLTIYFTNGAEGCYGLDRVEVTSGDGGVLTVTPYVGFRADAADKRCIQIVETYQTTITLDAPLLGGGVPGILGPIDYPADNGLIVPSGPLAAMEPQAWEAVQLGPDGASGFLAFTTGNPACFGFDHIGGLMQGDLLVLAVYTGPVAGGPQVCTMEAYLVQAPFTLETPILLGGGASAA
jgi:hypothetical protein